MRRVHAHLVTDIEERDERNRKQVKESFIDHLSAFAWDEVGVFTFRRHVSSDSARREFASAFIRRLASDAGGPISWFMCVELNAVGRRPHIHALLAGTRGLHLERIRAAWKAGISHVQRFDSSCAGVAYLSKTLGSPSAYYDCSWRCPPRRQRDL